MFEFDPAKSAANKRKRGIDFVEAQAMWDDPHLLIIPARTEIEPRFVAVGRLGDKHWSAVFTSRGDKVRLISVRRSREQEVDAYEGE